MLVHRRLGFLASAPERLTALPPNEGARAMCEKCAELDGKIEHYQRIARWVTDKPTLEGIDILIAKYEADKKALHPEGQ